MKITRRMIKKLIGVTSSLILCIGVVQAKTKITWGMWGSPTEIKTHQKVADAFMASHPNFEVVLWGQPWGITLLSLRHYGRQEIR